MISAHNGILDQRKSVVSKVLRMRIPVIPIDKLRTLEAKRPDSFLAAVILSTMSKRGTDSFANRPLSASVNVRAVGSTVIAAGSGGVGDNGNYQCSSTRPVTVRVLGRTVETESTPLVNFNVKIFNPESKKEQRVFVLRNVSEPSTLTPESLMNQFCSLGGRNNRIILAT